MFAWDLSGMNSLDLLTRRLFDYAGMFPPASLPLDAALAEAAAAPRLARPGMVGVDVVVASPDLRLVTPRALENAGFADTECAIALVGVDGAALKRTVPRVTKFNAKHAGVARIVSLEVHGTKFSVDALRNAAKALAPAHLFVEPKMSDRAWAGSGPKLVQMLGRLASHGTPVGIKVRGSGPNAISPGTMAHLIPQVVANRVPLKGTAGLHHALLDGTHSDRLGFVGLAAALRLHQALGHAFDTGAILGCLMESAPDAFSFEGEVVWRGHGISEGQLLEAVETLPFSIGTCSLREPDDDLVRLFGAPQ